MLENGARALCAVAAILRAAIRVAWLEPRTSLPDLVSRLRRTRPSRGPLVSSLLADPALSLGLLEVMLPVLPPFGAGRCLKRSLLLLDLWSRAGLVPSLHLGVRRGGNTRGGHAWVQTARADFQTFRSPDVIEAWHG
jgi:Transglutaminase-like superfamily